jgi:hypothetical protein
MVVHTAWYRVVYKPLLASRTLDALFPSSFRARQVAAMIATFAFSGCVHEYLIWCRTGAITGSQVVFFTGQALVLLLEPDFFQDPRGRSEATGKMVMRKLLGPCWWTACLVATLPVFFHDVGVPMSEFLAS